MQDKQTLGENHVKIAHALGIEGAVLLAHATTAFLTTASIEEIIVGCKQQCRQDEFLRIESLYDRLVELAREAEKAINPDIVFDSDNNEATSES